MSAVGRCAGTVRVSGTLLSSMYGASGRPVSVVSIVSECILQPTHRPTEAAPLPSANCTHEHLRSEWMDVIVFVPLTSALCPFTTVLVCQSKLTSWVERRHCSISSPILSHNIYTLPTCMIVLSYLIVASVTHTLSCIVAVSDVSAAINWSDRRATSQTNNTRPVCECVRKYSWLTPQLLH